MSHLPCAQILQYEKLNETFSAAALQYLMTDFKGVFRLTASMRILAIMPSCESRVTCHNSFFDMVCH